MKFVTDPKEEPKPIPQNAVIMAPVNLQDIETTAVRDAAVSARKLIDDCFAEVQRRGYWMSKTFELIRIWDLDRERVWAILEMWKRIYKARAHESIRFYTCGPVPMGEAAMDAYEMEQEWWFEHGSSDGWKVLVKQEPCYAEMLKRAKYLKLNVADWENY